MIITVELGQGWGLEPQTPSRSPGKWQGAKNSDHQLPFVRYVCIYWEVERWASDQPPVEYPNTHNACPEIGLLPSNSFHSGDKDEQGDQCPNFVSTSKGGIKEEQQNPIFPRQNCLEMRQVSQEARHVSVGKRAARHQNKVRKKKKVSRWSRP